jgi:hypothetical protein
LRTGGKYVGLPVLWVTSEEFNINLVAYFAGRIIGEPLDTLRGIGYQDNGGDNAGDGRRSYVKSNPSVPKGRPSAQESAQNRCKLTEMRRWN